MAGLYIIFISLFFAAHAFPQEPLPIRNTIFADEKLEGGIFEHVDEFDDITLYSDTVDNPYRLPTTTRPVHYELLLMTEIPRMYFNGEVDIQLYATQANVNEIVIHAHDMNITALSLHLGNAEVPIQDYALQPEYHFLRIRILNGVLNYNATNRVVYTLSITFDAPMRTDMTGLYRNWFRNNASDTERMMASTHFQATAARFAFPSYDEPNLKATFDVTIRRPIGYHSWFCTKLNNTIASDILGYEDDVYTVTPVMSTYLLALIVAEYESKPLISDSSGSLLYEVVARPGAMIEGQGDYAFEVGQKLLEVMSNHTGYDFYDQHPNLKMTQAAIPDFRAGAMEDWGLLLYREAYIMYDEEHTNSYYKQLIAYILSHEIAHMWFGNLVTCDWWDNFWLNEGFARYYQYFLTDMVETYMGLGIRFINEQVHTALLFDSSNNPHPLTNPGVGSPVAIRTMFSTISYNKGACIIRQTEHLLGTNVHIEGIRRYLVDRQFDTAEPIHLFRALQSAAEEANSIAEYGPDFNIIDYYSSWTLQAGHPVLNVQVDHRTGLMTVYQRRFNINTGYSTAATNWIIPVTFAIASAPDFNNTKPTHIIRDAITIINRTTVGDEWVIFNKQQTGFYRVNYDDYTWNLIVMALRGPQRTQINQNNRAQIVDDVFQFARSGLMTYNRAFNIISFLEYETEYTPWVTAITACNWIRNRLRGSQYLTNFETIVRDWTTTVMSSLGYYNDPEETFMISYLRYQMAPFVCSLNVTSCIESAVLQFQLFRLNNTEVHVDNRNWVYCNALRYGSVDDFNFLWDMFLATNVYNEKILILQSLGCTPHETALVSLLDAIVQENYVVRPQDYTSAFSAAVNGNEGNTQIVFNYIKQNLQNVTRAFDSAQIPLEYISSRLRSEQEIIEFVQWADEVRGELGTWYEAVRAGAQSSRNNLAWAVAKQQDIMSYYNERNQVLETSTEGTTQPSQVSTVTEAGLVEPTTPDLPDSAHTTFLSAFSVALAVVVRFLV